MTKQEPRVDFEPMPRVRRRSEPAMLRLARCESEPGALAARPNRLTQSWSDALTQEAVAGPLGVDPR